MQEWKMKEKCYEAKIVSIFKELNSYKEKITNLETSMKDSNFMQKSSQEHV